MIHPEWQNVSTPVQEAIDFTLTLNPLSELLNAPMNINVAYNIGIHNRHAEIRAIDAMIALARHRIDQHAKNEALIELLRECRANTVNMPLADRIHEMIRELRR